MKLLMVSGDRQSSIGEQGPFFQMQREFSRWFERIDVLCPRPDRPVTTESIHGNVHLHPASGGRAAMVGFIKRRGSELIASERPDLIVSHDYGWFYNGIGSASLSARSGVPYLSEIHHVPGIPVAADKREVFDRFVARRYIAWARSRARAFRVVNSGEMPALLRRWGVPDAQITVLPSLYIDLELFAPPSAPVQIQQDVLFVGRMVNNKGLDRIVDALALLRARGRRVSATLIGRGPLRAATEARVARAGLGDQVRFVDWVATATDLADSYRASRVLVCASTCEGGPRVTVESMACGTPAVSTRVGVMGELLADGAAGRLCGFDTPSLAESIEHLLEDEDRRLAMGAAARSIAERFEYARVLEGYARGLHDLVGLEAVRR
ncbi:glycosyltransferase family 4 protein [Engelhardtia mirabilis]|uniref:Mannosylfructose-phosphate synthase n=1 Tax=Engelhardtia mirabilis TaxID=2528011 RepID=A0A518BK77_9BACT|nr:Mannosylfructose-phosphate synthase [Planctomycetes bacterium Pla133]QDV01703.1 Mannosylfructose-phosphate synthase [Planctomycetes bacterium Pla86]